MEYDRKLPVALIPILNLRGDDFAFSTAIDIFLLIYSYQCTERPTPVARDKTEYRRRADHLSQSAILFTASKHERLKVKHENLCCQISFEASALRGISHAS